MPSRLFSPSVSGLLFAGGAVVMVVGALLGEFDSLI